MAAEGAFSFSVASVVEDVLQQHGNRRDLDLQSRRVEQAASRRNEADGWLRKMVGVVAAKMSYTREGRSPSPRKLVSPERGRRSRSRSRSLPRAAHRSRSRSRFVDASNPGNNLYVIGLSTRTTSSDLEKYFNKEGKVLECHLVTDPRSKESRGFAFITMETVEGAERCIKYLNRSVLEGRLITVQKAKRSRGRTPTPGRYQGLREKRGGAGHGRRRSRSHSPRRNDRGSYSRGGRGRPRSRSPYARKRDDFESSRRRRDCSLSADAGRRRR